jgi:serine/threonine-protein kinase
MSPEQAQASPDLDGRADLYGAGAILFECLVGRPPHTGESYEQVILAICMSDAPTLRSLDPTISEAVSAFVAKSLARDRKERFQNAKEMLIALHAVAPEERSRVPIDSLPTSTLVSGQQPPRTTVERGGPPTDVSWSRGSPPARAATPEPARPTVLSRVAVPLTAFAATLAGVIVTLWIVTSMQKRDVASPPTPPSVAEHPIVADAGPVTATAAPPAPIACIVPDPPAPAPSPTPKTPRAAPPAAHAGSSPQPTDPPKKPALDIAREL